MGKFGAGPVTVTVTVTVTVGQFIKVRSELSLLSLQHSGPVISNNSKFKYSRLEDMRARMTFSFLKCLIKEMIKLSLFIVF